VRSSFDGPKGVYNGVEAPSLCCPRPRSYTNFPSTNQPTIVQVALLHKILLWKVVSWIMSLQTRFGIPSTIWIRFWRPGRQFGGWWGKEVCDRVEGCGAGSGRKTTGTLLEIS
jgi:hypothetical protein